VYLQLTVLPKVGCGDTHEEGDEDRGIHKDQREDGRPTVSETIGDWTCEEYTDEGTALSRLEQGTLPLGLDRIKWRVAALNEDSVPSLEGSL
jgi:hypothetical protein